jgi:hypothetical protein
LRTGGWSRQAIEKKFDWPLRTNREAATKSFGDSQEPVSKGS